MLSSAPPRGLSGCWIARVEALLSGRRSHQWLADRARSLRDQCGVDQMPAPFPTGPLAAFSHALAARLWLDCSYRASFVARGRRDNRRGNNNDAS